MHAQVSKKMQYLNLRRVVKHVEILFEPDPRRSAIQATRTRTHARTHARTHTHISVLSFRARPPPLRYTGLLHTHTHTHTHTHSLCASLRAPPPRCQSELTCK